ncbi:hypothetical protein [Demequina salsinemoris]|uniref:hypothetical protein n=1 Tax=Demequina salsinemoris TaxID=577470 RepID=UPI0007839811|nr:hypothetical protein [Demequina salsinemoris]
MTFAHRFTLASEEAFDLEGATRWRARDERLRRDVDAYVIAPEHGPKVTSAVARISTVRDPRLARVIASGSDTSHDAPLHFVVVDRPGGTALGPVLRRRNLTPRLAGAIVGSIARALVPLSARGIHHGAVRSGAVTVSKSGVPVLSGLGIDGEIRGLDGDPGQPTEARDATDLVHLYLECLTGLTAGEASLADLPDEVSEDPRALCAATLGGGVPVMLADIVEAFPPDHGALRGFSGAVAGLPLRAEVAQAEMHETFGRPAADIVSSETLAKASRTALVSAAASSVAPDLRPDVTSDRLEAITAALPPEEPPEGPDAPEEEPEVEEEPPSAPPVEGVPEEERDLFDDLAAFDAMSDEQNAVPSRSVWEAMIEPLHRQWPQSRVLAGMYESAHSRAARPGPIRTRLLLLALGLIAVGFAWHFGMQMLEQPLTTDMDRHNPPENEYPAYTFDPTPSADGG